MLQTIRDYATGWITGIMLALIILSFGLFGIHNYFLSDENNINVVATVNDVPISKAALLAMYERLLQQANTTLPSQQEKMLIEQYALQTLVQLAAIKQATTKAGYVITDQQVRQYILHLPLFNQHGHFVLQQFRQMLTLSGLSEQAFFDSMREHLLMEQIPFGVMTSAFSLPNEEQQYHHLRYQQRQVAYLLIPHLLSQPVTITPSDIHTYYQSHQARFVQPPQVRIAYVELPLQSKAISAEQLSRQRDQLAELAYEYPDSLQPIAKALQVPIQETGFFTQQGKVIASPRTSNNIANHVLADAKIRDAAFSDAVLVQQNNSDVIQLSQRSAIVLRVIAHVPQKQLSLDQVKHEIHALLLQEKQAAYADRFASTLYHDLMKQRLSEAALSKRYHWQWRNIGTIDRYAKTMQSVVSYAFSLVLPASNAPVYGLTKQGEDYLIVAVRRAKATMTQLPPPTNDQQLAQAYGKQEQAVYQASQVDSAQIKINTSSVSSQ